MCDRCSCVSFRSSPFPGRSPPKRRRRARAVDAVRLLGQGREVDPDGLMRRFEFQRELHGLCSSRFGSSRRVWRLKQIFSTTNRHEWTRIRPAELRRRIPGFSRKQSALIREIRDSSIRVYSCPFVVEARRPK